MQQLEELGFIIKNEHFGYLALGEGKWTEYVIEPDGEVDGYFYLGGEEPVEKMMSMEEYIKTVKLILNK
jgi:hypothetical protein